MIPYNSYYSIKIGFITIQAWGLMVAIAFLVAIWLAVKEAKRRKLNEERIYGLATIALIGGILGSRIISIIEEWSYYSANPLNILKVWEGGLSFFGGLIGVLLLSIWYIKKHNLNFFKYADCVAVSLVIGHAIGRIGCILGDGGHIGKITTMPFGVLYNGEVRHLTSAYEFIGLMTIFAVLMFIRKRKIFDGFLFSIYAVSYGILRFMSDFLRTDPTYFGLTLAQYFSIILIIIFGGYLIKRFKIDKKKS